VWCHRRGVSLSTVFDMAASLPGAAPGFEGYTAYELHCTVAMMVNLERVFYHEIGRRARTLAAVAKGGQRR
jgi:hypothetical protein